MAAAGETKITAEMLQKKLLEELPATHVEVVDNSKERCGSAFEAIVVSEAFEGKGLLAQHKLVNKVLAEELKVIHAFSQKTYTPAKFEAAQK